MRRTSAILLEGDRIDVKTHFPEMEGPIAKEVDLRLMV